MNFFIATSVMHRNAVCIGIQSVLDVFSPPLSLRMQHCVTEQRLECMQNKCLVSCFCQSWALAVGSWKSVSQLLSAISSNYRCHSVEAFQRRLRFCLFNGRREVNGKCPTPPNISYSQMTRKGKLNFSSLRRAYACVCCLRACTYILRMHPASRRVIGSKQRFPVSQ